MKRIIFYTMQKKSNTIGIERKDGFELEIMDEKFYGYTEDDHADIVDPKTGMAIIRDFSTEIMLEEDKIEWLVAKLLSKKKDILESFLDKRKTKEYRMMQKRFKYFEKGIKINEKIVMKDS